MASRGGKIEPDSPGGDTYQPYNEPKKSTAVAIRPLTYEEIGSMGRAAGTKLATVTDKLTSTVKGADMDELGKLLGELVVTAKDYDPRRFKKGFNPIAWFAKKGQELQNQFTSVDTQIHQLAKQIDDRVSLFKTRVHDIEDLEQENEETYYELVAQIEEMERRIQEMRDNVPEIDDNDAMSVQRAAEWAEVIAMAEHRCQNLRLLRINAEQMAPQFRLMRRNSIALSQKFDDIKETTLPAWKRTFSQYILLQEQQKGVQLTTLIDDSTNEAMRRAADLLETNTVDIHRSLGRQVVDIATLEYTQQKLISAVQGVKKVAEENAAALEQGKQRVALMSANMRDQLKAIGAVQIGQSQLGYTGSQRRLANTSK